MPQAIGNTPQDSPIFKSSLSGLKIALQRIYQKDIPVVMTSGRTHMRALLREKGRITYPFFAYTLISVSKNFESYNWQALRHLGVKSGLHQSGQYWYKYHAVPVVASFRIGYYAQSSDDIYYLTEKWMFNDRKMSFILDSDGQTFSLPIQIRTQADLALPDQELEEIGELFQLETQVDMQTYVGLAQRVPTIIKIRGDVYTVTKAEAESMTAQGLDLSPVADLPAFEIRKSDPTNPEL